MGVESSFKLPTCSNITGGYREGLHTCIPHSPYLQSVDRLGASVESSNLCVPVPCVWCCVYHLCRSIGMVLSCWDLPLKLGNSSHHFLGTHRQVAACFIAQQGTLLSFNKCQTS